MKVLLLKSATSPLVIKYIEFDENDSVIVHDERSFELNAQYKASTEVFDQIDRMLADNEVDYKDIDRIYVASGPGSYTGARILVSIVKTIVFVHRHIELYDASLLDIFLQASIRANKQQSEQQLGQYAIVPARKNKYYVAVEVDGQRNNDELASTSEVEDSVTASLPCFVNGVKIIDAFNVADVHNTLAIDDWLTVSSQVADVTLYEPYYLEDVNIG